MSDGLARGQVDGLPIYAGDTVMIKAEVVRSVAGLGAVVRLYSKTDEMKVWVAEKHLQFATSGLGLDPEPEDGAWLIHCAGGRPRIFHRDDAKGHNDRDVRRHDRHWWDVVAEEWIDWPTACDRGASADDVQRMRIQDAS